MKETMPSGITLFNMQTSNELNHVYPLKYDQVSDNLRIKRATTSAQRRLRRRLRKRVRDLVRARMFARARFVRRRLKASHGPP
uniref:HNH endonuclease n=1 Tax=Strongyloides venezuelensis TaxID=75913 RepID=A0A0K0F3Q3_STRVS